MTTQST